MATAARKAPAKSKSDGKSGLSAPKPAEFTKDEELAALFMCSGNYTITHEIAQVGIPTFGGRHEGSMAHAADGFSRATAEVVGEPALATFTVAR